MTIRTQPRLPWPAIFAPAFAIFSPSSISLASLVLIAIVSLPSEPATAAVINDNVPFAGEPGGNFSSFNTGGLFTIATDASGLEISKPTDDGSVNPSGFILAGLLSNFTLAGDFTVTVDFTLPDLPFPAGQQQLNESLLAVVSNSGGLFEDLRFTLGGGRDLVEAYASLPNSLPTFNSTLTSGVYRISRVGSTISGAVAASDSSPFVSLGSVSGFTDPMHVQLLAAQGENSGRRSVTAIDIGFSGLTIQADEIDGVVPEPASGVLWIMAVVAGAMMRGGRRQPIGC